MPRVVATHDSRVGKSRKNCSTAAVMRSLLLLVTYLLVGLHASYYSRPYGSFFKGRSALIDAAASGETGKLGPLIKNGENPIELTQAVVEGHIDVVKLFWNNYVVSENVIWVEVF